MRADIKAEDRGEPPLVRLGDGHEDSYHNGWCLSELPFSLLFRMWS